MNIGLIGVGAIGRFLIQEVNDHKAIEGCAITALLDERAASNAPSKDKTLPIYTEVVPFVDSGIDLCCEASTVEAARIYVPELLSRGCSVVLSSVGCLADPEFYQVVQRRCRQGNALLYVPSGAIAGLDAIQAASYRGNLHHVSITSRKPSHALGADNGQTEVLFQGSAIDAIQAFPRNVNSAVALSLAGMGPYLTQVTVLADASLQHNEHTIVAEGNFGAMEIRVQNLPMEDNPKTSFLAALSMLGMIRKLNNPVRIG